MLESPVFNDMTETLLRISKVFKTSRGNGRILITEKRCTYAAFPFIPVHKRVVRKKVVLVLVHERTSIVHCTITCSIYSYNEDWHA